MKKYEKEVETYLSILKDDVKKEEMCKLKEKIEKKEKLPLSKKYAKEVLSQYGINSEEVSLNHEKGYLTKQFESIFKVIEDVINSLGKNTKKENWVILRDTLLLLVVVILLKIPFLFVRDIVADFLLTLPNLSFLSRFWEILLELIYLVFALITFLNMFRRRFEKKEKKL